MNRKRGYISAEFEESLRKKYPFAKSLYHATKMLNNEMRYLFLPNEIPKKKKR